MTLYIRAQFDGPFFTKEIELRWRRFVFHRVWPYDVARGIDRVVFSLKVSTTRLWR